MGSALIAAALSACGQSERSFVGNYVSVYCERYATCPNPLAVFDGTYSVQACRGLEGPRVSDLAAACRLDRTSAEACLIELEAAACPDGEALFDAIVPASCHAAWTRCDPAQGADESP